MEKTTYLVLQNGRVFPGRAFGATGEVTGEVVFTTGMTGYLETLTDPSYHGQIVVQTFPLIGNYGVIPPDFESDHPQVVAYIVKEWCHSPSNFRSEGEIDTFLLQNGIVGLCGVDTRALTKTLRGHGVMNGIITTDPDKVDMAALAAYQVKDAVAAVSPKETHRQDATCTGGNARRVVLWDFGAKANIARRLAERGCEVYSVPGSATADDILALHPQGIMLSNGPGNPAENTGIIRELSKLTGRGVPLFGICLGHQLLALATGARTEKLKFGHRGANHPVRELATGRVRITSQNHGYAVVGDTVDPAVGKVSFINANDGTCEGVDYHAFPAFSVQFHPEAAAGPMDTTTLFDRFLEMIDKEGGAPNAAE